MSHETIIVDVDDVGVATLTLNRPDARNAFDLTMQREFFDAMWGFEADDAVRAIVVTGAGKGFCAGVDLSAGGGSFGADAHAEHDEELGVDSDSIAEKSAFWTMTTPVIGALNGAAVGAGLTLSLLFDVRFAADDAKLAFVFSRRGIIPEANSTWLLPRLVGVSRAMELLLGAKTILGSEAAEIGLVSKALPRDEVLPAAQEFARDIAVNCAPISTAVTKRLVSEGLTQTDRLAAMQRETKLTWWVGEQPDAVEGVMSYLEKRDPAWTGSKHAELPADLADPQRAGADSPGG
ncbi:MAG: enoyl-CoA hydratase-related protein [Acidimicrobiia bacterium]|nr:enoyl-CoA hydratase-related protein [Acidimicrobiia bacterium]